MSVKQSNSLWLNLVVTASPLRQILRQGKRLEKKETAPRDFTPNGAITEVGMHLISELMGELAAGKCSEA